MGEISRADLSTLLKKALDQRAIKYDRVVGFGFNFADDNTGAMDDFKHFEDIMKALGGQVPRLYTIPTDCPYPQWKLEGEFRSDIERATTAGGRSLMIVHYAGHGFLFNGELHFGLSPRPKHSGTKHISYPKFMSRVVEENSGLKLDDPIDIILIIDSCYSGLATRKSQSSKRIVEVIAAVTGTNTALGNDPANPRTQARTFTAKLATHIAILKGKGASSVNFAQAVTTLSASSPCKKPTHRLVLGTNGIRVGLGPRSPGSSSSFPASPSSPQSPAPQSFQPREDYALVRVHLKETLTTDTAEALKTWFRQLDTRFPLSLDGVYKADSTFLIITLPHHVSLNMQSDAVDILSVVKSRNLVSPPLALAPTFDHESQENTLLPDRRK